VVENHLACCLDEILRRANGADVIAAVQRRRQLVELAGEGVALGIAQPRVTQRRQPLAERCVGRCLAWQTMDAVGLSSRPVGVTT
jgi:hypothetical protein